MPEIIRPGDRVRVLRDRFIERIGYPLVWTMLLEEVEEDPRTRAGFEALGFTGKIPRRFLYEVAKLRVEQRGFGGRERSIHYEPPGGYGRWPGAVLHVRSKRTANTGTYYPPTSGCYGPDYEWDSEPGGLADRKTHVILITDAGEIEACDVEKVEP